MLEFIVLVEGAFRAVGLSTGLDSALVKPLDFVGISSESFGFLVSVKGAVTLFILTYCRKYFIFAEAILEMIFLLNQLLDLIGQGDIGEEQAAVFGVVVVFGGVLVAGLGGWVLWEVVVEVEVHSLNKIVKIYINSYAF